jgi:hypothetical protein
MGGGQGDRRVRIGAIISDLCEWYGWTVDYVLAAPFVQMMTMYDYGCEKHYGRPVAESEGEMTKEDMAKQKAAIASALARVGAN